MTQLGRTRVTADHATFVSTLPSQSWDLVIVDVSANQIPAANQTSLINYITAGGRVLFSYWDLDTAPALANVLNVAVASSFTTVQNVNIWTAGHPSFTTPNAIATPVTFAENSFDDDGDRLTVLAGGTAIAGFTAAPAVSQAAIVLGNSNRTIVDGFLFDQLVGQNGINLIANEITFLVPEPSALVLGGALALVSIGRRRRAW